MLLLTSTSDKINLTTASSFAIDVHADFIDYNGTTTTPGRTNTAITSATTSAIVGAPAASTQRNIKSLIARNKDASNTQTLAFLHTDGSIPAQLFNCSLRPGETVVYTDHAGFGVLDATGRRKERSVLNSPQVPVFVLSPVFASANVTSVKTITSTSTFALYMGKAPRALTQVQVRVNVTTAMASVSWGEAALAKGAPVLGGDPTLTVVGATDVSGVFNSTGRKQTTITVDPSQAVNEGDDLWVLIGNQATTACIVRAQSLADDLGAGFLASATFRPSTNIGVATAFTNEGTSALAAWVLLSM